MGIYRLVLASPRHPDARRLVARHVDPSWLKQRGYEIARSLGEAAAVWTAEASAGRPGLALRCRSGHALTIETE
ncbi:hypothetical protein [Zoogloea sp.]|uniref:hypothetical protein n=1 Tax=Zoogloea sp. TaxID=49181 RepID=UPI0035AF0537